MNDTIKDLDAALADADAALAIQFCSKVLRKPLNSQYMMVEQRRKLLRELGVDADRLGAVDYTQKLVSTRIQGFCSMYQEFMKKTVDLKREMGFDTHRVRSGILVEVA